MFTRGFAQRAGTLIPSPVSTVRPFTTTSWVQRSPALADVMPENAHAFDQRQHEFREQVAARTKREREQQESQSASAKASTEAKHSSPSSPSSTTLGEQGLGSLTTGEQADTNAGKQKKVGSGPLSKLIYGTEEGRKMDQDIERSFSQVLARGKYVHSIVFHEVKPDKVDEYVKLVGSWYPRMADMPENKVRSSRATHRIQLTGSLHRFIL